MTELTFQADTTTVCGSVGQVKDDIIVEGTESFSLLLSSQNVRVLIQQNMAQVTIEDDDGMCSTTACFLQQLSIASVGEGRVSGRKLYLCTVQPFM